MITEAVIKNFKCFKQLTLPDLGRITIVGGKNNVGKTALLESLFLFFDRTSPNMVLRQTLISKIFQITLSSSIGGAVRVLMVL